MSEVEPCGACQPQHTIACQTCDGEGSTHPPGCDDPDWCPDCGGCGWDFVPAHPIGEAHA